MSEQVAQPKVVQMPAPLTVAWFDAEIQNQANELGKYQTQEQQLTAQLAETVAQQRRLEGAIQALQYGRSAAANAEAERQAIKEALAQPPVAPPADNSRKRTFNEAIVAGIESGQIEVSQEAYDLLMLSLLTKSEGNDHVPDAANE